jgi:hydrogenase nickel incorporation protein HypB
MSPDVKLIELKTGILADSRKVAQEIRTRLTRSSTFLLNIMSSPGSGKTSLIMRTIEALGRLRRIAVIEADMDSTVDADKVASMGIQAVQLRTKGFCHVEAAMVEEALGFLSSGDLDLIIIENVGNLICPAECDTGAHANVVILSVPEGDDKPLKYPLIFTACDVVVVNKIDYLEIEQFDLGALRSRIRRLNPGAAVCELSCRSGAGLDGWLDWLGSRLDGFKPRQRAPL